MKSFKNENELLVWALKGNQAAIDYCHNLGQLSQLLDDVIDGDKQVTQGQIAQAFFVMLCELPGNGFFKQHSAHLMAVLAGAFNSWLDANILERGSEHDKTVAFVLRDMLTEVVCQCAYLLGGFAWLREVSVEVRRFFHDESLNDYKTKLEQVIA